MSADRWARLNTSGTYPRIELIDQWLASPYDWPVRPVTFHMADPDLGTFEGWTDDTFWNGWLNVEVQAETHFAILGRIAAAYGAEQRAVGGVRHPSEHAEATYAVGLWEALSGLEQLAPDDHGRYSYANCYCTREAAGRPTRG